MGRTSFTKDEEDMINQFEIKFKNKLQAYRKNKK